MTSRAWLVEENGQTAGEYLGLVVVVAALIVALLSAGLGGVMTRTLEAAVCRVGRSACPESGAQPDNVEPAAKPAAEARPPFDAPTTPVNRQPAPLPSEGTSQAPSPSAAPAPSARGMAGALLDGFVKGDFNRKSYDDGWQEGARNVGQVVSGLLVVGDIRDAGAALWRLGRTGGREGWADLGWSMAGFVPVAGDWAKAIRGADNVVGALDEVGPASRIVTGGRGWPYPVQARREVGHGFAHAVAQ